MPKKFRFTLTVEVERDGRRPDDFADTDEERDYVAEDLREQVDQVEIWVGDVQYAVTVDDVDDAK